ncbi:uncharacterized protein LOC110846581 [Folsomia candida]|uniref:Epididymal secretory protein E1 n=1 Tax=Folsomia candida TaxID=158441 RepID=A0A226EZU8_FOLCA|nr:uncharacterized protein LOC110846581 [Folsomia candida]OXA62674.1 Epididymal secretory protein E1 [Folsomia candida]
MFKLSFAVLVGIVLSANSASLPGSSLTKYVGPKASQGPLALSGFTDCGVATLVDVTLSGCASAPCTLNAGSSYTLDVTFRPRDFHWDMSHRAILLRDTQLLELSDGPIPDSTIDPAQVYVFSYTFNAASSHMGQGEFRLKTYQNYVHELCLVIPINIV